MALDAGSSTDEYPHETRMAQTSRQHRVQAASVGNIESVQESLMCDQCEPS